VVDLRLIAFDFDETLSERRQIDVIAEHFGFSEELSGVWERVLPRYEMSAIVASFLRGLKLDEIIKIVKKIPLVIGAPETIRTLKERGFVACVISDGYIQTISAAMRGLPIDFIVANELEENGGVLTGRIKMPLGWAKNDGCLKHSVCKLRSLKNMAELAGVRIEDAVAVGNGQIDACMVEAAGLGIAFNPNSSKLIEVADIVIKEKDLRKILKFID
jgi:phosphoserine phosphatase